MRLNKSLIDQMKFECSDKSGADIRWDDQIKGFGVRVFPTGKKTFVLRYRINGRKRYLSLGAYGPLTLHQAREIANKKLVDVIHGIDPLEEKQKRTRGKKMLDLTTDFLERYSKIRKKSWREDEQRIRAYILPEWRHRLVTSITRTDVSALHHKIGVEIGFPIAANRTLQLISKMFCCAVEWGYLTEPSINPASRVTMFPENERERFVTHEEMPALMQAISEESNIYIRSIFWLYLLTGLRKTELRTAKWSDFDMRRKEVKIGVTKNGKPHVLPLSEAAMDILREIPKQLNNPYVFCGLKPCKPLVKIDHSWRNIRKKANMEDVHIHDLRRTVGSWLAMSGASLPLIGKTLNHKSSKATMVYARFAQAPVRDALDAHGKIIDFNRSLTV